MMQVAGGIILAFVIFIGLSLLIGLIIAASEKTEEDKRKKNGYLD